MMLINGQVTTHIDARDRGLSYGDGLFETLALIHGLPRLWSQHMRRLQAGCTRLGITMPAVTLLRQEVALVSQQRGPHQSRRAVIKITLTGGLGGRGYRRDGQAQPTRVIALFDWPAYPLERLEGIQVRWCDTRLGMNASLAGMKHLNRLEQVLARSEWQNEAIAEGLMLDSQNHVIEGTMSNLFVIKDRQLLTAELDQCGVAGIIRQLIIDDVINHGMAVTVVQLEKKDILTADEVFVCNSLIGIWWLKQLQDVSAPRSYGATPLSQHIRTVLELYLDKSADHG